MEPGRDGDVEVNEGRYWDVGLCTGVDGTDGVGSGGGVGGVCGDSDAEGSIGGSQLCGSGYWAE